MKLLLVQYVANYFDCSYTKAVVIIENYLNENKLDELMILTGYKE